MSRRCVPMIAIVLAIGLAGTNTTARAGRQFDDLPPPAAPAGPVGQNAPQYVLPSSPCPNCGSACATPWYGTRRYGGYRQQEPTDLYSRQVEHSAYSTSGGQYGFQLGLGLAAGAADQAAYPPGYGYRYPAWNSGYYNNGGFYPQQNGGGPYYGGPPPNYGYPPPGGGYPPTWGGGGYYPPPIYTPGPASLAPPVNPYTTGPTFW